MRVESVGYGPQTFVGIVVNRSWVTSAASLFFRLETFIIVGRSWPKETNGQSSISGHLVSFPNETSKIRIFIWSGIVD